MRKLLFSEMSGLTAVEFLYSDMIKDLILQKEKGTENQGRKVGSRVKCEECYHTSDRWTGEIYNILGDDQICDI